MIVSAETLTLAPNARHLAPWSRAIVRVTGGSSSGALTPSGYPSERKQRVDRDREEDERQVRDRRMEHTHGARLRALLDASLGTHRHGVHAVRFVDEPSAEDERRRR